MFLRNSEYITAHKWSHMKRLGSAVILIVAFASCLHGKPKNGRHIVLPSSSPMKACSSSRVQLWQDAPADTNAVYPAQVSFDHFINGSCPRGILALYDKSVSLDEIKAALDLRYSKWAQAGNSNIKLWRVESEKFAIQLATVEDGVKQVIYIAFTGTKCDCQ